MDELISKHDLIDTIMSHEVSMSVCLTQDEQCGMVRMRRMVVEDIVSAPTVDAKPVRRGRWIEESTNEYFCSYCGKYAPIAKNMRHCDCSKWCKECGTKMDGGTDNG